MFRSILVPLDGSPLAEWAVPHAIAVARKNSAVLQLIRIETPIPPHHPTDSVVTDAEPWAPEQRDAPEAYLDHIEQQIRRVSSVPVLTIVRNNRGRIADTLLQYAREEGNDLIVMTTHGYSPLKRFWLGSVADTVIRESMLPTLVIRPADRPIPSFAEAAPFRRVLIPIDGSPAAETVLDHALGVAAQNAQFTLLRALAPQLIPALTPEFATVTPVLPDPEIWRVQEAGARSSLERVAIRLRERDAVADTAVTLQPYAPAAILDYAHDNASDLIAITTHGHGGALRLLLGSIADKIVRGADVPVLVYRPV